MSKKKQTFLLNTLIGFLSVLLLVLIVALLTRFIYPRVSTDRTDHLSHLISEVIQIEVLNGCGVPGIATRFTNALRNNGFDVVDSGNFESFDVRETIVIDRSGNLDHAIRIARSLGISEQNIIRETSPNFYLDATVVIGADYEKLKLN
ncbi:MAG: LytR C-terminal domain-containing protein [Rhodothermaceae bacterium]|nr:LytR C-terminal domain-containing protein [Rhodothermaceae bacterium]